MIFFDFLGMLFVSHEWMGSIVQVGVGQTQQSLSTFPRKCMNNKQCS